VPKNEDGEFELILGNRQLLSVFFIVVILLGVFFTMGYIVGRNSTPLVPDVASGRKADSKPLVVEPPAQPPPPAPDTPSAAPPSAPPPQTESTAQQPTTTAQQQAPATPERSRPEPGAESSKPEPVRAAKNAPAASSSEPGPGQSYLQLAATSKREADIMVDVLRQKGFKAMAAEIPEKHGTFRVLVGPVTDSTANKTRADLQGGGFPGNAAIRRTF